MPKFQSMSTINKISAQDYHTREGGTASFEAGASLVRFF
jgi:hypothetical protein